MATRRRVPPLEGRAALAAWLAGDRTGVTVATAVRFSLEELATRAPGGSVEVRIPPYGAVQCVEGPRHTRGTPPRVVEMGPEAWLELVTGRLSWEDGVTGSRILCSGTGVGIERWLPLSGLESVDVGGR